MNDFTILSPFLKDYNPFFSVKANKVKTDKVLKLIKSKLHENY